MVFAELLAVCAQLGADAIWQNAWRGLAYARERGRVGGRPSVMSPERVEAAWRHRPAFAFGC